MVDRPVRATIVIPFDPLALRAGPQAIVDVGVHAASQIRIPLLRSTRPVIAPGPCRLRWTAIAALLLGVPLPVRARQTRVLVPA